MKILVTGNNGYGQLQETAPPIGVMSELDLKFKIKKIACGYYHVFILTENNELYGCGNNTDGELGLGHTVNTREFTKINTSKINGQIKEINCGGYYSTLLTKENELYLTGQGVCGQLGFGNEYRVKEFTKNNFNFGRIKKVKCCGGTTIVLNENGVFYFSGQKIGSNGEYVFNFQQFYYNSDIVDFLCGYRHVVMLDKFGKLFEVNNISNITQITIPLSVGKIKQIGTTYSNFFILNDKNELFVKEGILTEVPIVFKINKLYSGLSSKLYFSSNNGEKLYSIDESNKNVQELTFSDNKKEKYFYPILGNDFAYIINSDNPNLFSGESKEVERMMQLLFKQQTSDYYFNNSFKDISVLY